MDKEVESEVVEKIDTQKDASVAPTAPASIPGGGIGADEEPETQAEAAQVDAHDQLRALVMWQSLPRSAAVFGAVNVTFFLLIFGGYTVIRLVGWSSLLLLFVSVTYVKTYSVARMMQRKDKDANPHLERWGRKHVLLSREDIIPHVEAAIDKVNELHATLRDVYFVVDSVKTVKFGLALFAVTIVGGWFSILTWLYLAFLVAFIGPVVYSGHKHEIHAFVDPLVEKMNTVVNRVPFLKEAKAKRA